MSAEVNVPLLRKAVEWAEAEAAKPAIESQWNQNAWIAEGRTLALDLIEGDTDWSWDDLSTLADLAAPHCGTAYCIAGYIAQALDERYATTDQVDGIHASEFAADALGIPMVGVAFPGHLFNANNTIEDVRRIAESLAGERL